MHIAIDARFIGPKQTGLGRYTDELVRNLEKIDSENQYTIILRREGMEYYQPEAKNFAKIEADYLWYSVAEQMKLPRILKKIDADFIHFCHFNVPYFWRQPFIVTIHDLIKDEFKGQESTTRSSLAYAVKHKAYGTVSGSAIKRADYILTPSQATKDKIKEKYKITDQKIFVTHEAADPRFAKYRQLQVTDQDKAYLQKKYNVKFPFLLYVGNSYPYKNLNRLLDALKKIDQDINFVNPCARSVFYERLKESAASKGLAKRVILPGFVSDEDLPLFYRTATAYVFPSLSEGFGLPLLEAQMAGLPIASSSAPPLPEIGGQGALYFDPHNSDDMAAKINQVLASQDLRDKLVAQGLENIKKFSWQKTAKQTLAVYQKMQHVR
ncbi:glycosyltransferase family 4 protein [Patescibacteria group bacterium]